MARLRDRRDAGRESPQELRHYANHSKKNVPVALGGIRVSYDGALALHIPSDIFIVRNPLLAGQQELATGAITSGGIRVLHEGIVRALNLSEEKTNQVAQRESQALRRREQAYKGKLAEPDMRDRLAIMIDPMFICEVC